MGDSPSSGPFRPVVRRLPFIPDLPSLYRQLDPGGPRVLFESGDERGHSYLCGGEESPMFEVGPGEGSTAVPGRSIELLRQRIHAGAVLCGDVDLELRNPGIFTGGGIGFLGYDFARTLEAIPVLAEDDLELPYARFFFPSVIFIADHESGTMTLVLRAAMGEDRGLEQGELERDADRWSELCQSLPRYRQITVDRPEETTYESIPDGFTPSMERREFIEAVNRTIEYIRAGDIFQANLSIRASCPYTGDPVTLYEHLRTVNPSPYMTLMEFEDLAIVGASPEQLLRVEARSLATRPIAGTRRRGRTEGEDEAKKLELLASPKERAEHLMMVDLERNDIGRVAAYGSVRVDEFMSVERYSHVIHIVSNVTGRLADGQDRFDALGALFPGGTITGAPKVRAMEIIEEMEPVRRGIYTGSIGWIGYGDGLEMNIAIRSILLKDGKAMAQAGAGIVADSVGVLEYRESLKKLAAAIAVLKRAREGESDSRS